MRRLFADRDFIRAAVLNPGGSVILTGTDRSIESANDYSAQIGNDYHLDLLQAELEITNNCEWCADEPKFTDKQIEVLLAWAAYLDQEEMDRSGLSSLNGGALRRRRQHAVHKVAARMTNG